ncbi:MAG: HAD family phosphatase [Clostridiales bacterium]|nr:HAD family phosphatase [Clostridiales bacterium]
MIKTIIFDIGNVLTGFEWRAFFQKFGYSEETLKRISKATVESGTWAEYDRGVLADEEIMDAFIANDPGIEKELRESLQNIQGMLVRYDYAIPWIKELKEKGYQVLVLSNFASRAYTDCKDALDFLEYVDGGILSFKEKVIKPQPEIYELLISRYKLNPQESVFLDDTVNNLTAAEKFGIHTIHFTSKRQAEEELWKLGVE